MGCQCCHQLPWKIRDPGKSKQKSSMLLCLLRSLEELPGEAQGQGNREGFLEEVAVWQSPVT